MPLYANKFENLDEVKDFLENRNSSRMSTKPEYTNKHIETDKIIKDCH